MPIYDKFNISYLMAFMNYAGDFPRLIYNIIHYMDFYILSNLFLSYIV